MLRKEIIILMSIVIIIYFHTNLDNYKCFCENKNGTEGQNGIMCGMGQYFRKTDLCSSNEWCTGPSNANDSAPWDYNLCSKGKMYSTH